MQYHRGEFYFHIVKNFTLFNPSRVNSSLKLNGYQRDNSCNYKFDKINVISCGLFLKGTVITGRLRQVSIISARVLFVIIYFFLPWLTKQRLPHNRSPELKRLSIFCRSIGFNIPCSRIPSCFSSRFAGETRPERPQRLPGFRCRF